jgi:hypothetical protein
MGIFGGTPAGFGYLMAELNVYGVLSPSTRANPVGNLTLNGDLIIMGDGGELDIDLGGANAGTFDIVNVSGQASLGGTLVVRLVNGYAIPASGASYPDVGQGWLLLGLLLARRCRPRTSA